MVPQFWYDGAEVKSHRVNASQWPNDLRRTECREVVRPDQRKNSLLLLLFLVSLVLHSTESETQRGKEVAS